MRSLGKGAKVADTDCLLAGPETSYTARPLIIKLEPLKVLDSCSTFI